MTSPAASLLEERGETPLLTGESFVMADMRKHACAAGAHGRQELEDQPLDGCVISPPLLPRDWQMPLGQTSLDELTFFIKISPTYRRDMLDVVGKRTLWKIDSRPSSPDVRQALVVGQNKPPKGLWKG